MKPKHIVVVDGLWAGHHPTYIKVFAKLLVDAGYQVTVLCPEPREVESWVRYASTAEAERFTGHVFSEQVNTLLGYMPSRLRNAFQSLDRWRQIAQTVRSVCSVHGNPDLVFFAWLDSYLTGYLPVTLIDRLFPFAWSGLYFHPRHLRVSGGEGKPRTGWFALPDQFLARSKWATSVAVLDSGVLNVMRDRLSSKPVVTLPDFTDEVPPSEHSPLVAEIRAKARGRKIIGLLGGLERRKGLLTLIRIAGRSTKPDWYFVFAGVLREETFSGRDLAEVQTFFSAQREDSFFHLNRIPDDAQFNAIVKACDVIFAVYEDFPHSSNLITKAALFGKSILVSRGGYMEEVVRSYGLGECVSAGDVQSVSSALCRLINLSGSDDRKSNARQYAQEQSQERLRSALIDLVESSTASTDAGGNGIVGPRLKCNNTCAVETEKRLVIAENQGL